MIYEELFKIQGSPEGPGASLSTFHRAAQGDSLLDLTGHNGRLGWILQDIKDATRNLC